MYYIQSTILLNNNGIFDSLDRAAIRREHPVYTHVCVTCGSLELLAYRALVGVCFTEVKVKNIIREMDIAHVPDATGEMLQNPGVKYMMRGNNPALESFGNTMTLRS